MPPTAYTTMEPKQSRKSGEITPTPDRPTASAASRSAPAADAIAAAQQPPPETPKASEPSTSCDGRLSSPPRKKQLVTDFFRARAKETADKRAQALKDAARADVAAAAADDGTSSSVQPSTARGLKEAAAGDADGDVDPSPRAMKLKPKGSAAKKSRGGLKFASGTKGDDAGSTEVGGGENTSSKPGSFADAAKAPPKKPAPLVHSEKAVVELTVRVGASETRVRTQYETKLAKALTILQATDKTAAFLPHSNPKLPPLTNKQSFPELVYTLNTQYFCQKNDYALNNNINENGRTIKCSALLGMNIPIKPILAQLRADLITHQVGVYWKEVQALDTTNELYFLGAPNKMDLGEAGKKISTMLQSVESGLMERRPLDFPAGQFGGEWPEVAVTREWPQKMPWEDTPKGGKRRGPPPGRRTLSLMCPTSSFDRLKALTLAAKDAGVWTEVFGPFCYPTEVPNEEDYEDEQIDRYVDMVNTHASVQESYGSCSIPGLLRGQKEYRLRRVPLPDGSPQESLNLSVIDVMLDMKFGGASVWHTIQRSKSSRAVGYFSGTLDFMKAYVPEWCKCPAAQVYFYLVRRGCFTADVSKMIKGSFDTNQQRRCSESHYDEDRRLAFVERAEGADDIVAAVEADEHKWVDRMLGVTETQKARIMARQQAVQAASSQPIIDFGSARPGSLEAFNFEDMSTTTMRPDRVPTADGADEDKSTGGPSLGESIFDVVSEDGSALESEGAISDDAVEKADAKASSDDDEVFTDAQDGLSVEAKAAAELSLAHMPSSAGDDDSANNDLDDSSDDAMDVDHRVANPESFFEHLWNAAGPARGSILTHIEALQDQLQYDELSEEFQWNLERNPHITTDLWDQLQREGGNTRDEVFDFLAMVRESVEVSSEDEFQPAIAGAPPDHADTEGVQPSYLQSDPSKTQPRSVGAQEAANAAAVGIAMEDAPGQGSGSHAAEHGSG